MFERWFKVRDKAPAQPAPAAEAPDWLPDAHFGSVAEVPEAPPAPDDDEDPDDELLDETPPEVVMILGFDPALEDEGDPEEPVDDPDA